MGVYVPVYVNVYVYPPVDVVGSGGWGVTPIAYGVGGVVNTRQGIIHIYIYTSNIPTSILMIFR